MSLAKRLLYESSYFDPPPEPKYPTLDEIVQEDLRILASRLGPISLDYFYKHRSHLEKMYKEAATLWKQDFGSPLSDIQRSRLRHILFKYISNTTHGR